jgi:hypothetical protein
MKVYTEEDFIQGADITDLFKDVYIHTTETDCDYFIITSIDNKLLQKKDSLKGFINKAKAANKKVIFLGQGDIEEGYIPTSIGYNFKNNLTKTTKYKNEFSMTSLTPERVPNRDFKLHSGDCSIGFVGADDRFNRAVYLRELSQSNIPTQFIIKNGPCWGTISHAECTNKEQISNIQQQAEEEFYKNMSDNLFNLCIRGWGNYSYRFCQTICMGRIPVLIDTDCCLPFEEVFNYDDYIVRVTPGADIATAINNFLTKNKTKLNNIQQTLFVFGNEHLTPLGFFKNIHKVIDSYERNN